MLKIEFKEFTKLGFNDETKVEKTWTFFCKSLKKSPKWVGYVADYRRNLKKAIPRVNDQNLNHKTYNPEIKN